MNYEPQLISASMGLEEALKEYSNDINIITLKDGTNIKIVQDNQQFKGKGRQESYNGNQMLTEGGNYDDFVQKNIIEDTGNLNYQQMPSNYQGPLRGRGMKKKLGKSLRKTILKTINGTEQESKVQLRFFNKNNGNPSLNKIIQLTEDNEYQQCANCKRFFLSDEKEEQDTNQKNNNQTQNQKQNNQQILPQTKQCQQTSTQKNPQTHHNQAFPNQIRHFPIQIYQYQEQPQLFTQYNYPSYYDMPHNQKKQKIPIGYSPKSGKHQSYPQKVQTTQKYQQQYFQQIPVQKKYYQQQIYAQNDIFGGYGSQGNYPISNHYIAFQNQGQNNFSFRTRKKESNRFNPNNSFNVEGNYPYSYSAKKQSGKITIPKKLFRNMSNENLNSDENRKLSYGFKRNILNELDYGYNNNNFTEYMGMNNIGYDEFPQPKKSIIPIGNRLRKINNHQFVTVKMANNQYQDEEDFYN